MKKYILIYPLIFIALCLNAQTKRAYKSLEKLEYDKAKEAFEKSLADDSENVACNFGLAMVLSDDKSPFFDIISAWQYIEKIEGRENELTQEEIEILGEYFLNTEIRKTSRPVKKKMEIAMEAVGARFIKYIREENDLDAVYRALELYPDFIHHDNIIHIRNQFEFRKYEKQNTRAGYEEFIEKFPEAAQVEKAKAYRNKMAFEEIKLKNSVAAYNQYINDFPDSKYIQPAIKLRNAKAFVDAKSANTLAAYQKFIELYPDALEIPEAYKQQHQLMYEKAKRIKTLEAYNEFIRMYPDGAYYVDVFNLKSADLGMQEFRKLNFNSPDFIWARALDNNEYTDKAKTFAQLNDGSFILVGTTSKSDSAYCDSWIIKLDPKGNMLWNKTIGQPYNEKIKDILLTPENDIIVIGYTQASTDSSDYLGWMYKLNSDGGKVWNKKISEDEFAACAISADNKIYLSSFVKDTLDDHYYLQAYNQEGKKIWERDYVRKGIFNDLLFNSDGSSVLAGSSWIVSMDPKFFIKWEDTISYKGEVKLADSDGTNIITAGCDSSSFYFSCYSSAGTKNWRKTLPKADSTDIMLDLTLSSTGDIIIIGNNLQGRYLKKFSNKGDFVSEKLFFQGYKPVKAIRTKEGISYLFENNDFLITTFSSVAF
ncbi:MAG: hypothetical protein JXA77_01465 [Bacteroidales bacterium]|nr:hypothetical protein [Bacteroidales bacterium]MBN2820196.1 hypothetical protein [Bacteroidales bacterium]